MAEETFLSQVKRLIVGAPIPSHLAHRERFSRVTGLAVLSSDPLSSVAYATEEILRVLALGGVAALGLVTPIGAVIAAMLAIVVFSYRQTIYAYPSGGGAYIVAKDNLGSPAEPHCGVGAVDRLRADGFGEYRRRRGGDYVGIPILAFEPSRVVAGLRRDADVRQPARRSRVRPAICRTYLLLHRFAFSR